MEKLQLEAIWGKISALDALIWDVKLSIEISVHIRVKTKNILVMKTV